MRVGLFSIGLDAYWPQSTAYSSVLVEGYNKLIANCLGHSHVEVVNLGLIDTPEKALTAGHQFRAADVDLIFLHVATYALSSTVLPVVRRAKTPVIILNLAPGSAIDYSAFNQMRDRGKDDRRVARLVSGLSGAEIANVFRRCGVPFLSGDWDAGKRPALPGRRSPAGSMRRAWPR